MNAPHRKREGEVKGELKAGVAEVEITPNVGIDLTGYILREGPSTGIHDPLFAKALVLDDGMTQAAIVCCDILGLDSRSVATIRAAVNAATGIPGRNVMLLCTHTHAGPASMFLRHCGEVDLSWLDRLGEYIVQVVQCAIERCRPARIGAGQTHVVDGIHNRRRPGDPVDPALGILRVEEMDGTLHSILLNYACHPTCLDHTNRLISADYIGYATSIVAGETGATTLFATGAIGDVGPRGSGYRAAAALGHALADGALQALNSIQTQLPQPLYVASTELALPLLPPPSPAELKEMVIEFTKLSAAQPADRVASAMLAWAQETLAASEARQIASSVPAEIQVLRIGDMALVGVPGELFVELGLAIKRGSDLRDCFVCGFANGNIGYIPTRYAYPRGRYEVTSAYRYYGYPAALAPEAGEAIVQTAIRLIQGYKG